MILQIPETMPEEHYAIGGLNLLFFIIFASLLLGFGMYFIYLAGKQLSPEAKRIKLSYGLFGIFYGLCRIFFILMFHIEPDKYYNFFAGIAYSLGMIGFVAILWAIEKAKYQKRKYTLLGIGITIITIIGTIFIGLGLIEIREIILQVIMLGMPLAFSFILILYLSLIKNTAGIIRKKALYSLIGFTIMVSGVTMDGQYVLAMKEIPLWFKMNVVPIICIVGFLIFVLSQLNFPKRKKAKKIAIPQRETILDEAQITLIETLAKSRPAELTEEEVSISKEKKICLVCKGKLLRHIYLCPKCEAFYCDNCSRVLEDYENACWVCDTPFDEAKPVTPYIKEEEVLEPEVTDEAEKKPKKN